MINKNIQSIFKKASKTYYYSSIFFTKEVKKDVFDFYAFVRLADDFVDKVPQDTVGYYNFKNYFYITLCKKNIEKYNKNIDTKKYNLNKSTKKADLSKTEILVIEQFTDLMVKRDIDLSYIDSFFYSMEMDILDKNGKSKDYLQLQDTLQYIYGSAEIIGLIMCKILGLKEQSYKYAQHLGRAMQYANFIRDIDEDISLKRCYFAKSELDKYNLKGLKKTDSTTFNNSFSLFINAQIKYFNDWQLIAEKGYYYIENRYLVPIKTAADMYKWTTKKISENPLIVFEKKVKPSILLILITIIKNYFWVYFIYKRNKPSK